MARRVSKEEKTLHDRLRAAHERNLITVYTDFQRLNAPDSPVFNPWEAVGPLLALLLFSLFILLTAGLIAGTVALVLSVMLFAVGIKPWMEHQLRHRAIVSLMRDPRTLTLLWAYGGVGISLADQPRTVCAAPDGNWRNFVRRHLPDTEHVPVDEDLARADFSHEAEEPAETDPSEMTVPPVAPDPEVLAPDPAPALEDDWPPRGESEERRQDQ